MPVVWPSLGEKFWSKRDLVCAPGTLYFAEVNCSNSASFAEMLHTEAAGRAQINGHEGPACSLHLTGISSTQASFSSFFLSLH